MSKYKDMAKEKWDSRPHANIRGRASGLIGRNKESASPVSEHVSRPLSDLRDPASFAPPPKRTAAGLVAAPAPSTAKRSVVAAPSKYQDPRGPPVEPPPRISSEAQLEEYEQNAIQMHDNDDGSPSPKPWSLNSTGLRTDHLPPPPGRRDGADRRSPPSYETAVTGGGGARPPPSLPPRLPPRTGSGSSSVSSPPPSSPAHTGGGLLNQGAVNRLGAAGVSVPALGIGRPSPASPAPADSDTSRPPQQPPRPGAGAGGSSNSHLNELQNRFSKMSTSSGQSAQPNPPNEGTTWQQKQAAFKTASSFHKDPSSVSLSDVKSAASTANNFRQRHGDQVAAGLKSANNLNEKYGVTDRVGSYAGSQGNQGSGTASPNLLATVAAKKKPPPPPKKKPGLGGPASPATDEPPPIPLSTRPT